MESTVDRHSIAQTASRPIRTRPRRTYPPRAEGEADHQGLGWSRGGKVAHPPQTLRLPVSAAPHLRGGLPSLSPRVLRLPALTLPPPEADGGRTRLGSISTPALAPGKAGATGASGADVQRTRLCLASHPRRTEDAPASGGGRSRLGQGEGVEPGRPGAGGGLRVKPPRGDDAPGAGRGKTGGGVLFCRRRARRLRLSLAAPGSPCRLVCRVCRVGVWIGVARSCVGCIARRVAFCARVSKRGLSGRLRQGLNAGPCFGKNGLRGGRRCGILKAMKRGGHSLGLLRTKASPVCEAGLCLAEKGIPRP